MVFDTSIAMTWVLFIALFPMAFIWFRRAWRIFKNKDYSEVALKRGEAPPNPARWAPVVGLLNLVAGLVALAAIIGVVGGLLPYDVWSAMAGVTIWSKIILDFIISRQAHPMNWGKKKSTTK